MATVGTNILTLEDWAKRQDPDGTHADIVEMLGQTNEILDDALWIEGNLPTGHQTTVRTGLPASFWRLLNQGIQPTKSTTAQVTEGSGMLESWSEVDVKVADLGGNTAAFRIGEASAHLEGMSQDMAEAIFYSDSGANPEELNGLAIRFSSLGAANGQNIVDGGGTGSDNSSIWLVVWGLNQICMFFPKGSAMGLTHENIGKVTVEVTAGIAGNRMRAYQDHFVWDAGLALKDWRYVVRIANIDISALTTEVSAADLFKLMIRATHRIPNIRSGRPVFYMNRTTFQMLDIQGRDAVQTGGQLTYVMVAGRRIPMFRGIPVKVVDRLRENEAQIT